MLERPRVCLIENYGYCNYQNPKSKLRDKSFVSLKSSEMPWEELFNVAEKLADKDYLIRGMLINECTLLSCLLCINSDKKERNVAIRNTGRILRRYGNICAIIKYNRMSEDSIVMKVINVEMQLSPALFLEKAGVSLIQK